MGNVLIIIQHVLGIVRVTDVPVIVIVKVIVLNIIL